MNDERFNRDLGTVLREIAGEEAPMSLRNRLARITDEAPIGRRLWFSPPMRLATAAVVLVAAAALAVLLVPRDTVGPTPSASAEPSAPASVSLEPSPSVEPSAEPTAVPTPVVVGWTGLDWSPPVTPFAPNTSWIADIVPWGDGYIGVGGTLAASGPGLGTVFSSTDGLRWTVAYQAELPTDWAFASVVPVGDGLLAISNQGGVSCEAGTPCPPEGFDMAPRLWFSANGADWSQIDSPSWRVAWGSTAGLRAVAGGARGVVAVSGPAAPNPPPPAEPSDGDFLVYSADGQTWTRVDGLPAQDRAIVRDVEAYAAGFVIVGRDGELDPFSQVTVEPLGPGTGRPAAWISSDGLNWTAAEVDGTAVAGGELRDVAIGANGMFATGNAEPVDMQQQRPAHGWVSGDGQTWRLLGRLGSDIPDSELLVGDGVRMLILGADAPGSATLAASFSTDGVTWTRLAFSGETAGLPEIRDPSAPEVAVNLFSAWVDPRGLIVGGTGTIAQQFWFASAIYR